MELTYNINLKIKKTVWFYLLTWFRIKFNKKPLIKVYINNEKNFEICLADITKEK